MTEWLALGVSIVALIVAVLSLVLGERRWRQAGPMVTVVVEPSYGAGTLDYLVVSVVNWGRSDVGIDGVSVRLLTVDGLAATGLNDIVSGDSMEPTPIPYTLRAQHSEMWWVPTPSLDFAGSADRVPGERDRAPWQR